MSEEKKKLKGPGKPWKRWNTPITEEVLKVLMQVIDGLDQRLSIVGELSPAEWEHLHRLRIAFRDLYTVLHWVT